VTYLTVAQACAELGGRVAPSTIRRAIRSGRLYAERPARRFLIPLDSFNRFRASAVERAIGQCSFKTYSPLVSVEASQNRPTALFSTESDIDMVMRSGRSKR
jgi:excisionase family DNA binding protein